MGSQGSQGSQGSLGRLGGVSVRVHWSWVPAFVLAVVSLALARFPERYPAWPAWTCWLAALLAAAGSFVSILFHELAHARVAAGRGVRVDRVTLFIFGGVSRALDAPRRPADELAIAAAGPLASLAGAGAGRLLALLLRAAGPLLGDLDDTAPAALPVAAAVLWQVALVNATLAVFNALPAFPLDGGRVARALLWRATGSHGRATRWAAAAGRALATALLLGGVYQLALGWLLLGAWAASLGLFLDRAALAAAREVAPAEGGQSPAGSACQSPAGSAGEQTLIP